MLLPFSFYSRTSCVGWRRLFGWHDFFPPNLFELYQTREGCDKMVVCVCVAWCGVCWCTLHSSERPTKLFMGRKGCCFCCLVECGKLTLLLWYLLSCFADGVMNERWLTGIKKGVCASSKISTAYSLGLVSTVVLLLGHIKCCGRLFAPIRNKLTSFIYIPAYPPIKPTG